MGENGSNSKRLVLIKPQKLNKSTNKKVETKTNNLKLKFQNQKGTIHKIRNRKKKFEIFFKLLIF